VVALRLDLRACYSISLPFSCGTFTLNPTHLCALAPAPIRLVSLPQYVLPNVEATLTGVRAAVIILLVAALFAGLNYALLSQGWLQSTLSFEVFKAWYVYACKHSA
jgi:hypothetical protein